MGRKAPASSPCHAYVRKNSCACIIAVVLTTTAPFFLLRFLTWTSLCCPIHFQIVFSSPIISPIIPADNLIAAVFLLIDDTAAVCNLNAEGASKGDDRSGRLRGPGTDAAAACLVGLYKIAEGPACLVNYPLFVFMQSGAAHEGNSSDEEVATADDVGARSEQQQRSEQVQRLSRMAFDPDTPLGGIVDRDRYVASSTCACTHKLSDGGGMNECIRIGKHVQVG